jgi:hypothetical protein
VKIVDTDFSSRLGRLKAIVPLDAKYRRPLRQKSLLAHPLICNPTLGQRGQKPVMSAALDKYCDRIGIDWEFVRSSLSYWISSILLELCAEAHSRTSAQMVSGLRDKPIMYARNQYVYLMRQMTNWSLRHIGRSLGNRDKDTIICILETAKRNISLEAKAT